MHLTLKTKLSRLETLTMVIRGYGPVPYMKDVRMLRINDNNMNMERKSIYSMYLKDFKAKPYQGSVVYRSGLLECSTPCGRYRWYPGGLRELMMQFV